ncbi:MAG: serine protease [bacterium]|nr:serine protease [bacterium]
MRIQTQSLLGNAIVATLASSTWIAASEPPQPWSLEAGFEDNPRFVEIAAGGPNQGSCGFLPDEPQLVVDYVSGDYAFGIGTASDVADTTVEVTTPSGNVLCDDDSGGSRDALVTLDNPESGQYEIRVGTYSYEEIGSRSDVFVTELIADGTSDQMTPQSTHRWSLEAGFEDDPRSVEIAAGGPSEGSCGFLPDEPQLVVDYVSGDYAFGIGTASDEADTTVEVTTPSGDVLCDDDSGGSLDALVTLDNPESGQYEIRVGTYSYEEIGRRSDVFVTELIDGETGVFSGTGFLVSGHHIITNWHVVDGAIGSVMVRALGLPEFQAEVVMHNEEDDIALLYAEDMPEGLTKVVFRSRPPVSIGETIFAFGFPMPNGNFTQGNVAALTGADGDLTELQFTAPVQPGSSGSPLFDAEGHVIGMVTSRDADGQLVNFALRGTLLRVFLDANNVDYELADFDDILPPADIGNRAQDAVVELIVNSGS